jgi:3-methyl-2-oxobutanoate hydroxymethyltransferase
MTLSAVTVPELHRMKVEGRKITMLTAYDATIARLVDQAGVDIILVGDSLGMVVQGHRNTLPVTVDHMAYHCACVSRAVSQAHIVGDLPFLSYHVNDDEAVRNAGRLVQEGGAHSVKLEGGRERARTIEAIVRAQIPVMGHVGLTPQSVHVQGGFKVQGRGDEAARRVIDDALAVEEAGAYSVVLEGIPLELAAEVTARLSIPTIGIGAGPGCDGQVLVIYDLLGMDDSFKPKFVKRYAELGRLAREAVGTYLQEVRGGSFPDAAHSFEGTARKGSHLSAVSGYGPTEGRPEGAGQVPPRGGKAAWMAAAGDCPTPMEATGSGPTAGRAASSK